MVRADNQFRAETKGDVQNVFIYERSVTTNVVILLQGISVNEIWKGLALIEWLIAIRSHIRTGKRHKSCMILLS